MQIPLVLFKQGTQRTYIITLRRVHITTVAKEKQ